MQEILVIRFGALGDLCLAGWTLSRLAETPVRVTLVTKARFADLAARFEGVDEVLALPDPGGLDDLRRLAARLRARRWDQVLDLHRVLRSGLLLILLGRRADATLAKDTVARLRLLRGGPAGPALAQHMCQRLDAVLDRAGWTGLDSRPPLAALATANPRPAVLGLAPGAQWEPKRWPAAHWAALVRRFRAENPAPIRVFLGPREEIWFAGSALEETLSRTDGVELVRDRPLTAVAAALAGCRLLVCNDSGLLHLAEATGTPVTALFGPTVQAFGYAPRLPGSVLVEESGLDCRPCSRNGKRPCHRGDLACLERIDPDRVLATVAAHGPWKEH